MCVIKLYLNCSHVEQETKMLKPRSDELVLKEGSPCSPKITKNISAWKPFPNELLTSIKC